MSRVGKTPIKVPDKVTVNIQNGIVEVKGPKGLMSLNIPDLVNVSMVSGEVVVACGSDSNMAHSRHGLVRNLIGNMVRGVSEGFVKKLEITGIGYRAEVKGKNLLLSLGFSHPLKFPIPDGISITVNKQTELVVEGINKQLVGETAACIRRLRPPEPYKGKGIKYSDEVIQRKAGKTAV